MVPSVNALFLADISVIGVYGASSGPKDQNKKPQPRHLASPTLGLDTLA